MFLIKKIDQLTNAITGFERSDPYRNGEFKFIRSYIKSDMIIIDAGANTGYYAKYILSINPFIKIHCFEPSTRTFNTLIMNMTDEWKNGKVVCNNLGLSNESKEAELFIYDELDGRNSLHFNQVYNINPNAVNKETIKLTTLTKYVSNNNISRIDYLKIDVEGHESKVIEGASDLINQKVIKCIQFEYSNNWRAAGFTLEDVFNKLNKYGYKFYRLAIWGKIPIKNFNKKLENYKHANYVAIIIE